MEKINNKKLATAFKFKTRNIAANDERKSWQDFDTCCLDVSLFNRYQQDDYLLGTVVWINDRFENCIINVGDTLHRHNLLHEYNAMEVAHQKAHELGDKWIAKNEHLLQSLTIPYKIIRNDFWLEQSDFQDVHNALWAYYLSDKTFRNIVNNDIETFVNRQKGKDQNIVRKASLSYLLEEAAVDILFGKQGGGAHLYPGGRFDCYWYLTDNAQSIPPILRGLENSAFKRLSPSHIMRSYKRAAPHTYTQHQNKIAKTVNF